GCCQGWTFGRCTRVCRIWGRKSAPPRRKQQQEVGMVQPLVGAVSQSERLVGALAARSVTHGQTVRADVEHVEVSGKAGGGPLVYFCGIHELTIRETLAPGDGGGLPAEV